MLTPRLLWVNAYHSAIKFPFLWWGWASAIEICEQDNYKHGNNEYEGS